MPPVANPAVSQARPYSPGPRAHCRRLAHLAAHYYQVHAHLPQAAPMPLALENLVVAAGLPCDQPHDEQAACPDCRRLLSELLSTIGEQAPLRIWPIIDETIGQIEAGPVEPASPCAGTSPTRRAITLLPRLTSYRAVLHGPCERCGSQLWAEVPGGYRCLLCAPPLHFPDALRAAIAATCV